MHYSEKSNLYNTVAGQDASKGTTTALQLHFRYVENG